MVTDPDIGKRALDPMDFIPLVISDAKIIADRGALFLIICR